MERVDWAKIIDDFLVRGWTIYAIAKELDQRWEKVNNWRHHEPKHYDGQALLKLHSEECTSSSSACST